mgnify:CR=1 FL=1
MMNIKIRSITITSIATLALLAGCSEKGPAEEAGARIDDAVEDIRERLDPAGPAERTGRQIDEALEQLDEAVSNAVEQLEEGED